jgi:hypothetical protein
MIEKLPPIRVEIYCSQAIDGFCIHGDSDGKCCNPKLIQARIASCSLFDESPKYREYMFRKIEQAKESKRKKERKAKKDES